MRKTRIVSALLLPLALLLTACGGTSAAGDTKTSEDGGTVTLNVGDQKAGSQAILQAAGELDHLPYKIQWSTFPSGPPLLEAVGARAVDIGGVGNTPPVFAAAAGAKITVVAAFHGAVKHEAIVVRKDSPLQTPEQLKGEIIAVAQGSAAHYGVVASLQKAGLSVNDVKLSYLQPSDALAAFNSGKVDAWAIWDPFTSQVLKEGGRVLTDGEGITNGLNFQVAAPSALADKKKSAAIADYLQRLRRAGDWVYKHPEEWAKTWAQITGLPEDIALASVKASNGTRVPVAIDDNVVTSEQQIADTFQKLKLIPGPVDFSKFVDKRFSDGLPPSTTEPRSY